MSEIFIIPFHVKRTESSIMPEGFTGAYVSCYADADGYEQAIERCVAALAVDGMQVEEILQPIHSMAASHWSQHVYDQWPDHTYLLPNQKDFVEAVSAGKILYGPFGAY